MAPKPKQETPKSPFFHPSTPNKQNNVVIQSSIEKSPGGTQTRTIKKINNNKSRDEEHKAGILGTCGNVINSIIGAGIVGIPFAMQQTGLASGIFMTILVTLMTEKSLRLLIETAKYIDVPSYEMLFEACFGQIGFVFLSSSMFIMSYGAMISYLMIVKDTLPVLLGVNSNDETMKCTILILVVILIMFPISSQRDMADLAKTSNIAVMFDIILVSIVIVYAPVNAAIEQSGGIYNIISNSIINPKTFFVGVGVLSFAFVCQHSSFIVAGSLSKPTNQRWASVTFISLIIVGFLELTMGTICFLTFQEETSGNVLNNFTGMSNDVHIAANICRALLCTTMICVFPMDVFVTRHVSVVLFFKGRRAHEGDDHMVLARWDRRLILTAALIISALIPALICHDLGNVLSISGSVGGSCVSYIGPGCTYLGIHGQKFLALVDTIWKYQRQKQLTDHNIKPSKIYNNNNNQQDIEKLSLLDNSNHGNQSSSLFHTISWYILLMPIWCSIASYGSNVSKEFQEDQLLKSPHLSRLAAGNQQQHVLVTKSNNNNDKNNKTGLLSSPQQKIPLLPRTMSFPEEEKTHKKYGTVGGSTDKKIAAAIAARYRSASQDIKIDANANNDDNDDIEQFDNINPKWKDFIIAIFFILFGVVAMILGLVSVFIQ